MVAEVDITGIEEVEPETPTRLTFRAAQHGTAWQKQLRDRFELEGMPDVPHLDLKKAEIRRVSSHLASQIILKYEWLGTMAYTNRHYGIFFGDYCAGVCCVSAGGGTASVYTHKMFNLPHTQLATLARGACVHWAPPGTNSKLVSWTCRLLAQDTPCKVLIAYADTDAGEIGTIYQACNWIYIGRGAATRQWVAPNGRVYDQKLPYNLSARGKFEKPRKHYVKELLRAGWREQMSNPKHRYVQILDRSDKSLVSLVEGMRKEYPKRAGSISGDALSLPG